MSTVTAGPEYSEPASTSDYWAAEAARLADALERGGWLEPREIIGLGLRGAEVAYADLHASGWRYTGSDEFEYERRALLLGGPLLMAVTAGMSLIGNRRRRREAADSAAPQWRALGPLRVVVTSQRLLVWHYTAWWSVWHAGIARADYSPAARQLDLCFIDDIPYRFGGPHTPVLAVMVDHLWRACAHHSARAR